MDMNKNYSKLEILNILNTSTDEINFKTIFKKLEFNAQASKRSDFVASQITSLVESHKDRINFLRSGSECMTVEEAFRELIPKISLGRRFGHSYGIMKYISQNQGLKIAVVTSHIMQDIYKEYLEEILDRSVNNFSYDTNASNIYKSDVILVDELLFVKKEDLYNITEISLQCNIPMIVLGSV